MQRLRDGKNREGIFPGKPSVAEAGILGGARRRKVES